jgi:hypothetical protein
MKWRYRMSDIIVHYGRLGMKWGVRNDKKYAENRAREQKKETKRRQEREKRKEAAAAKRASDAKAAGAKKGGGPGGMGGGGGGAAGEAEEKGKATAESVYDKAFQEAMAEIEPPITKEKIAEAQKAAEKAVEEAGLNEEKGGKPEKEPKGGPPPKEDPKAAEKKAREKLAKKRSEAAEIGTAIATAMTDGSERTPEKLKAEAAGINKMLKMVEHDKPNHDKLRTIGARALAESKGGAKRSPEQLKEDAAFVKKMAERFAEESEFMKNFGKKDKDAKHGDEVIVHYGVKGMRWGVRKKVSGIKSGLKKRRSLHRQAMDKEFEVRKKGSVKTLNKLGLKKAANAVSKTKPGNSTLVDFSPTAKALGSSVSNKAKAKVSSMQSTTMTAIRSERGQKSVKVGAGVVGALVGAGIGLAASNMKYISP